VSPYAIKAGIIVTLIVVIGLDVYLATDNRTGNTYSEVIRGWFKKMTWLPILVSFALGVLMAHWGLK